MTKVCRVCHANKDILLFHKNKASHDGFNTICKICKHLQMKLYWFEYGIKQNANRRSKIRHANSVVSKMKSGPCVDCGKSLPSVCMDFDHIGDDKHEDISRMVISGTNVNKILREIDKCELVCVNCHRIRTEARRVKLIMVPTTRKAINRAADRERARQHVINAKKRPCVDCGGMFHNVVMDFDHKPGTIKIMCVTEMITRRLGVKKIQAEINKCDLVCANCHRVRTFAEKLNVAS